MTQRQSPVQILEQAEKLLGRKEIAAGLKVREDVVKSWYEGTGTLSNSHLLRLADLLTKYAAQNR
ncbi:MAG: hypothetical protein JF611_13295 [Betaproteobacteria bacterium]|jgi:hypothetical protein|nr:hypothetical protein [Betaproteobacteria bacterium]